MNSFVMNGYSWNVEYVPSDSHLLIDRTNELRLATTDPRTKTIYLSDQLWGETLQTVLLHELGHCVMFSYGLVSDIHRIVPEPYWIDAEEWVCNFIADYGKEIFSIAYNVIGDAAWMFIPYELEQLIA